MLANTSTVPKHCILHIIVKGIAIKGLQKASASTDRRGPTTAFNMVKHAFKDEPHSFVLSLFFYMKLS